MWSNEKSSVDSCCFPYFATTHPKVGGKWQWDDITDKPVVFDQVYYPGCKLPS